MHKLTQTLVPLQYLFVYTVPLTTLFALYWAGIWAWSTLIYVFAIIPLLELWIPIRNIRHEYKGDEWIFDLMLLPSVFILPWIHWQTLNLLQHNNYHWTDVSGMVIAVGLCNGILGINVAHEMGHRKSAIFKFFAHLLLCCSSYLHFFIEHNFGHHKKVSTPEDPASARYNENLYAFWWRSITQSYVSAFKIGQQFVRDSWIFVNPILIYLFVQVSVYVFIYFYFSLEGLLFFLGSSIIGILLLETVNYIEHYGLSRGKESSDRYERVAEEHSWDSDHLLGRLALFELTRHSDHHMDSTRHFSNLNIRSKSPKMPVGYPGSMLTALIPPLWFKTRNHLIDRE
ncbi:MAG: alkane 1-monooxygenase [Saprospiraceae bacterium]|nr:alkane 1-monooxygenase [Saprospiraceae bacterium]